MSRRPPAAPPELAGYTVERHLGSGGFADVYLYTQHMPRRHVAVKVLTAEATAGSSREQFIAEANLMAQLSTHSSIVTIHHADQAPDGRPYLVMQYCPLPNLAERVAARPLGVPEALAIGVRLAGAVETAHRAGIVHRDIKPANVLTTEYGRPALTDFGIAGLTNATVAEAAGVSIPWAPPEALEGHTTAGVAGDVYSLAATLYTLLAGRSPYLRPGGPNTRLDYLTRIRRDPLPPVTREDVPASLDRVLARAMAKSPTRRYPSALDLARALHVVEQELRLPLTEIEVPDTSWLTGSARGGEAAEQRTVVRGVLEVDPDRRAAVGNSGPDRRAEEAVAAAAEDPGTVRRAATGDGDPDRSGARDGDPDVSQARPGTVAAGGGAGTDATVARPVHAPAGPPAPRRSRRALLGSGVLVLLAVGGIGVAGALRPAPEPTVSAPPPTGIPVPERVPAPVELTGTRAGAEVTFTWAPPPELAAAEITYTWYRTEPGADPRVHPAGEPTAVVAATGQVCLAVKVRLPNGTTSAEPARACVA